MENQLIKTNHWPEVYQKEIETFKRILGNAFIEAHHIGSTAIIDIFSKPKIDIALIVTDLKHANILCQHGYKMRGEFNIPFRHFYLKKGEKNFNVHVMLPGNHELDNFLCFRNYMNSNKVAREKYSATKLQLETLISQKADTEMFNRYTLAKNAIITQFIKDSGFEKICMRFVAHYTERQFEQIICAQNNLTINNTDIRVVLYKGAAIIGYGFARNSEIQFITSTEKLEEFRAYFQKWLKTHGGY